MRHKSIRLLITGLGLGSVTSGTAQECPSALPLPAERWMIECKADPVRCAAPIPLEECDVDNQWALDHGLITHEAWVWLYENMQCVVPRRNSVAAICSAGCFERSTQIMTVGPDAERLEKAAHTITKSDLLASLTADATLEAPDLTGRRIRDLVSGPEGVAMFAFELSSGKVLRVTRHHGMVLEDGRVIDAKDVKVHDTFVGVDGEPVEVTAISTFKTEDDVHNFRVEAPSPQEHVIVAEGVLVGDLAWQNELARERASIRLRR